MCATSIALTGLSPSAWGMGGLSSWIKDKSIGKVKKVKLYPALKEDITSFLEQDVGDFCFTKKYIKVTF